MTATAADDRTLLPGPAWPPSAPPTSFPLTDRRRVVLTDDPCEAGFSGAGPEYARIYLHARYFDPKLGTFLSPDPIGVAGGMNLYGYGLGDRINLSDRGGLNASPFETCFLWSDHGEPYEMVCVPGGGGGGGTTSGGSGTGGDGREWGGRPEKPKEPDKPTCTSKDCDENKPKDDDKDKRDKKKKNCLLGFDFASAQVSAPFPPLTAAIASVPGLELVSLAVSVTAQLTVDRYGRTYFGIGPGVGFPSFSGSIQGGKLSEFNQAGARQPEASPALLSSSISGHSASFDAGAGLILGKTGTFGQRTLEYDVIGAGSPQIGEGYQYTWQLPWTIGGCE